jgi:hypothetical protein
VQSAHHALVASEAHSWLPVQSVTTDHVPGTSVPPHVAPLPLQYFVTVRCRASEPHAVPEHPYSTHESQA